MQDNPTNEKEKKVKTSSSIRISSQTVCEDEACIGKIVSDASASTQKQVKTSETRKKKSGTAMSFGGKQGCTDEACIGIK